MCMGRDVARNSGLNNLDNDGRVRGDQEEEEQGTRLGEMTAMAPPIWPPGELETEVEEDLTTEVGAHMGYLQISNDPMISATEEQETQNNIPLENGMSTTATNGHAAGSLSGAVVSDGRDGHAAGSLAGAVVSDGRNPMERVVTVNGMQFHVYGNVGGWELLGINNEVDLDMPDSEEEEEEERRRAAVDRAIREANEADAARRAAPIPPEHRARIVNAMKGIDLAGFRPSWADFVPEDQWINKIKNSTNSSQQ